MKNHCWWTPTGTVNEINEILPSSEPPYHKEFATLRQLLSDAEKYHNAEEISVRDGILTLITQQIETLKQTK